MQKKKLNSLSGLVYSTDPNFKLQENNSDEQETLPAAQQKLRIVLDKKQRAGKAVTLVKGFIGKDTDMEELGKKLKIVLDKKQRAGKAVTLVEGFIGKDADMEELGKKLKTFCGTGGSVKDGEIIIQGDNRDKVLQWFQKNGYTAAGKI